MKREDLVALGLTDEQIEKVIAENSKDVQSANSKATKYKEDADKLKDVQKELEDLKNVGLSDAEKITQDLEKANAKIAELEASERLSNQRNSAVEKWGITSEQSKEVIKDDGSLDFDALGKIISDQKTAAATAKEQELAKGALNPNGGAGGKDDSKPADVANAESINFGGIGKDAQSARDYYK